MKKSRGVFWGLLIIAIAILWLLSGMDIIQGTMVTNVILSGFMGVWFVKGLAEGESFNIFFPIAILAIVWDKELGIEKITPWPVIGAAILLSIGTSMIFKGCKRKNWENKYSNGANSQGHRNFGNTNYNQFENQDNTNKKNTEYGTNRAQQSHADGEHVYHMNRFSGAEKYIDSQNLKSVEIINKYGGIGVYLDKAVAAGDRIYMRIECVAGGMEIYIPKSWKLENRVNCFAGAVETPKGEPYEEAINDVTLELSGTVKAGGVEIIRV